jgi:hypothetical protein
MRTQVSKISKIVLLTIIMCAVSFSTNAQYKKKGKKIKAHNQSSSSSNFKGCNRSLTNKNGEVFSVAPGILTTKATSDKVTISIKKTGGRAETQVNIYVNNVLKQNKKIEFDNGAFTTNYKNRILSGVKGKTIKVEIVNQSVANSFKYTAKIVGKVKSLMSDRKPATGTLIGQGFKNVTTKVSCTGKTKIVIRRTGGKARGTIRIFEQKSNGSYTKLLKSETFEKNDSKKEFIMNSSKKLKIELKNISVGNTLKFKINAKAIQ